MSTLSSGAAWELQEGDCVPLMADWPEDSFDMAVFSPPFASLFAYSGEIADIGNSHEDDGEFKMHMAFFAAQLFRAMKRGRIVTGSQVRIG